MMWGGIVTFAGWMLYGLVAPKLQGSDTPALEATIPDTLPPDVVAPEPRVLTHA